MSVYKKNGNWFIDFWCRGKRYRKKVGPDKRQAELVLKKAKVDIAENKFLDVKKQQKILFCDMAKEYLERYSRLNKKSFKKDESIIKQLNLFFENKYLYEITPLLIEDYKAKHIKEGHKPATVNRQLALLKHIFTKAIEWNKTTENPVKKVKLFKVDNKRTRFLEKGDIKSLLDNCSDFLRPIVAVALYTGMRLGELLSLTWDDIDFNRGIITVKNTKNNERRYIPINTELANILDILKQNCNQDSPYVFCDTSGHRLNGESVSHMFKRTLQNTSIKDFRFHDLRHTFASHLVMSGIDIITVKELLGHKTLDMTLRYSHLSPNFKRSSIELLRFQPDTFWTPEHNKNNNIEQSETQKVPIIGTFQPFYKSEVNICQDIQNGLVLSITKWHRIPNEGKFLLELFVK